MRLWSIHPEYLDAAGLVALWREALLAQAVLAGRTRGYVHHPQLLRFRQHDDPIGAIGSYLDAVAAEAERRRYSFDRSRIERAGSRRQMVVTEGQLLFELQHLKAKLRRRNADAFRAIEELPKPLSHPMFQVIAGGIAPWEKSASRG